MTCPLWPQFPCEAPRSAFANADLPGLGTVFQRFNLWILNQGNVRSSVFPSGHVTVVSSAAFAMLLAVPENRRVWWTLLDLGLPVLVNTVYGSYHYARMGWREWL